MAFLTGCTHSTSTRHLTPLSDVSLAPAPIVSKWQTHVLSGSGLPGSLHLQPAVDPYFVYSADSTGMVVAEELETGRVVWRTNTHLPLTSGPVLQEHWLIIGSNNGDVWALDTFKAGAVKWKASVSSSILAKPVVDERHVYIQTNDSVITALNIETGEPVWVVAQSEPALILRGTSAPAVLDQTLFVGTHDGKVVALNKNTGALVWEKSLSLSKGRSEVERMVDIIADIKVDEMTVYVASYQGRVVALNPHTGAVEWQKELSVVQDFSLDQQALYVTDSIGMLYALEKHSGATLWQQDALKGRHPTGPLVAPPYVLVGDAAGYWHWFALSEGRAVAREKMGDPLGSTPQRAGSWVVGLGQTGTLIAIKQK